MADNELILGTRGSRLAIYQAEQVAVQLRNWWPDLTVSIQRIQTHGDRHQRLPLDQFSGTGIFVKELEQALLDGRVDAAVHSLKDVPTEQPAALGIAAIPIREEWRDALVSALGRPLSRLRPGSRIGTGSLRRAAQLLALRRDLRIAPIRGNVETRIHKVHSRDYDATVLSYAGLLRLGLACEAAEVFSPSTLLPAPGQGAIAVEARRSDNNTLRRLRAIHDEKAGLAVEAERTLLATLGGGCQVPVGALALPEQGGQLKLAAVVCSPDGRQVVRAEVVGNARAPASLAEQAAEQLFRQGAEVILRSADNAY